jgi:hypothetical protein
MMRHYLASFKAAEPWRETLAEIDRHEGGIQRDCNGGLCALHEWNKPKEKQWAIADALAVRKAIGPLGPVWEAADALDEAMAPAPEEIIRAILGVMLSILRAKPTEGAEIYVDALVLELTEPETGAPICAPAIAAAARETWNTQTFAPSVHEFMGRARKQQQRIEIVRWQLRWILNASYGAYEVLEKLAPEKLPKLREWSDEELDEIFGPE